MSDSLGEILIKNMINMGLEDSFPQHHEMSRRTSLSSFFGPTPKNISQSSEQLIDDISGWPLDIWSENVSSKPRHPFRPDRSMSLTENCLPNFGKMKTLEVPPPPGFPPLNNMLSAPSNRYKTELCRSFQENGSCKYGSKCQFAHGESELRGLHRHPKYKTEACRTFYNFGYCPYGSRCHFIHEEKLTSPSVNQRAQAPVDQNRRLRQSVSFAGFMGSRSSPPPTLYEPMGFTRAPSVSPPPTDTLSPVFNEAGNSREMFHFGQSRTSEADIHNIPLIIEPQKSSYCVCGHGNNLPSLNKPYSKEDRNNSFITQPSLQRFSSEDSLSDRESYSSTGSSSGSESPTFDGMGGKRLSVFARMSVSE
ncbi:mRNA decay activator protein ZFP36L1 [Chanos chanos]|uniref:mRNA decay activator protein ZFP36 n=1 Tax=Chanos chanos TaxID=29144 RepID=A0A6J2VS53_CHACN|nr:mRNA decay activator protein ZFP36L1-like [Chanos chanos]